MAKQTTVKKDKPQSTYRKELIEKKTEFLNAIASNFKALAGSGTTSEDDLITISQEHVIRLGMNRVLYEQLRQVESAIRRLDFGQFGTCSRCETSISSKRLQAVPWTTYCVDCQDKAAAEDELQPMSSGGGGNYVAV